MYITGITLPAYLALCLRGPTGGVLKDLYTMYVMYSSSEVEPSRMLSPPLRMFLQPGVPCRSKKFAGLRCIQCIHICEVTSMVFRVAAVLMNEESFQHSRPMWFMGHVQHHHLLPAFPRFAVPVQRVAPAP